MRAGDGRRCAPALRRRRRVSLTGAAGPEPHGGAEPGHRVDRPRRGRCPARARLPRPPGERDRVRRWAEQAALDLLRRYLDGCPLPASVRPDLSRWPSARTRRDGSAPAVRRVRRPRRTWPTDARRARSRRSARRSPDARWVPAESRHVTLKFLGPTCRARRPGSANAAAGRRPPRARRFDTAIDRRSAASRAGRARVLWAGPRRSRRGRWREARVARLDDSLASTFARGVAAVHAAPHALRGPTRPLRSAGPAFAGRSIGGSVRGGSAIIAVPEPSAAGRRPATSRSSLSACPVAGSESDGCLHSNICSS